VNPDPLAGYAGQQARRTLLIGTACALFAAWLYGANIPAARAASQAGLPGAELIFYRSLIMVPVLGILAMVLGVSLRLGPAERGAVLRLAIAAGLTATFYLSALDHLAVPLTVVIFYTFPLIVMVVSNRLEGRPISRQQVMVFVVAFAGLVLAVGPSFAELTLKGVLFALTAACACAAMFLVAGRVEGSTVRTLFWIQLVVAPISLAFMLINGGPAPLAVFLVAPISIAIAMGAYAIAFVFQLMASQRISASRTSLLFLFEPVTAIIFAAWFIGETLAPLQLFGVALILAALAGEILLDMPARGGAAADPP
jgi:drug/metabolite transporter (DMT)-like permease